MLTLCQPVAVPGVLGVSGCEAGAWGRWARPARIVNVSSSAHQFGTISIDDLQSRRNYQPWRAYGQVGWASQRLPLFVSWISALL